MKTTPKESPKVIEARQRVEDLSSQIKSTKEELGRLHDAHHQAQKELSEAIFKADEHLPQATLWQSRRFEADKGPIRVVILRQTPTGQLVCRFLGSIVANEMRFKISKHDDTFRSTEKPDFVGSFKYIKDVPEEYIKAARKHNT